MSAETAAPLVEDSRIKLLTFTGFRRSGWALKARAGKKKVALELGGNAGCIVHGDAELDKAVGRCVAEASPSPGRFVVGVRQRILVERGVCEAFTGKLAAAVQKLRVGDMRAMGGRRRAWDGGSAVADAEGPRSGLPRLRGRKGRKGGMRRQTRR